MRRSLVERALGVAERWLLCIPWPSTERIALRGLCGFLKQVARSRALDRLADGGSRQRAGRA